MCKARANLGKLPFQQPGSRLHCYIVNGIFVFDHYLICELASHNLCNLLLLCSESIVLRSFPWLNIKLREVVRLVLTAGDFITIDQAAFLWPVSLPQESLRQKKTSASISRTHAPSFAECAAYVRTGCGTFS